MYLYMIFTGPYENEQKNNHDIVWLHFVSQKSTFMLTQLYRAQQLWAYYSVWPRLFARSLRTWAKITQWNEILSGVKFLFWYDCIFVKHSQKLKKFLFIKWCRRHNMYVSKISQNDPTQNYFNPRKNYLIPAYTSWKMPYFCNFDVWTRLRK